jgi:hypothetical protein
MNSCHTCRWCIYYASVSHTPPWTLVVLLCLVSFVSYDLILYLCLVATSTTYLILRIENHLLRIVHYVWIADLPLLSSFHIYAFMLLNISTLSYLLLGTSKSCPSIAPTCLVLLLFPSIVGLRIHVLCIYGVNHGLLSLALSNYSRIALRHSTKYSLLIWYLHRLVRTVSCFLLGYEAKLIGRDYHTSTWKVNWWIWIILLGLRRRKGWSGNLHRLVMW